MDIEFIIRLLSLQVMKHSRVIQNPWYRCDFTVHSSYINQAGLSVTFLITYDCFMTSVSF